MEFRITHKETGKPMIEVRRDDHFIAAIYADDEDGLRIVSERLDGVKHETGIPPSLVVKFTTGKRRQP